MTGQSGTETFNVFLFERATGTVTVVSHVPASSTTTGNDFGGSPSISADGAFVAFRSFATNLVAGQNDANAASDVFRFERATGAVRLVSRLSPGSTTTANGSSESPSISADGAFVAFESTATDLGQSDTNAGDDVFLFARVPMP